MKCPRCNGSGYLRLLDMGCRACDGTGQALPTSHSPESSLMAPDEEDRLQERVKELDGLVATLRGAIKAQEGSASHWRDQFAKASREVESVKRQCSAADLRCNAATQRLEKAALVATKAQEENARLKAELELLRYQTPADWQRFKDERDALKAELAQTKAALAEGRQVIEALTIWPLGDADARRWGGQMIAAIDRIVPPKPEEEP